MFNVFVYGTLKKEFYNHNVIKRSNGRFIGDAITDPIFTMVSLGAFPAVIPNGDTTIKGELYETDSLEFLDRLEGYPSFYNRKVVSVKVGDKDYLATMYYIDTIQEHSGIVESGEWR